MCIARFLSTDSLIISVYFWFLDGIYAANIFNKLIWVRSCSSRAFLLLLSFLVPISYSAVQIHGMGKKLLLPSFRRVKQISACFQKSGLISLLYFILLKVESEKLQDQMPVPDFLLCFLYSGTYFS